MTSDNPYEDVKLLPMCLPVGRPQIPKVNADIYTGIMCVQSYKLYITLLGHCPFNQTKMHFDNVELTFKVGRTSLLNVYK